MAGIYTQAISAILDNYADVIEGGNSYRGSGTAWSGIAGFQSIDQYAGTTMTEDTGGSTTAIAQGEVVDTGARLARTDGPPMFCHCTTASNSSNLNAARKISAYNSTTGAITLAKALPANNSAGDVYTIAEGFKRIPDGIDINDDATEIPSGFDRFFHLTALPGKRREWYGNGVETYETTLDIRLRFLKRARARLAAAAAWENLMLIRSILSRPTLRDGTYAQLLDGTSGEPKIETDDQHKIVAVDSLRLIYRINARYP